MKTYKLYGDTYELDDTPQSQPDGYALKGELLDERPAKGKLLGYIAMDDGSVIECYKAFNPVPIVLVIILLVAIVAGVIVYFMLQPKDVVTDSGTTVKQGMDNNVVSYNGFMALRDDALQIDFQNGDYAADITISGEGVEAATYHIEPNQFVATIPATCTTDAGVVNAKVTITTATSTSTFDVVIEIPANNTPDSPTGLEGNWKGEHIYGVQ